MNRAGFTLVELLVVVTIIVILIALLAPAMDRAIYQAQLTVCGANQKSIGNCVVNYAMDFKRYYPNRAIVATGNNPSEPVMLANENGTDDRKLLRPYIPLKLLRDPFVDKIPLEADETLANSRVHGSYCLWFGVRFPDYAGQSFTGMKKMGDRFTWFDDADYSGRNAGKSPRGDLQSFSLLSSDLDFSGFTRRVMNGHPDSNNLLYLETATAPAQGPQTLPSTSDPLGLNVVGNVSRYAIGDGLGGSRGLTDSNYAFDDGSVQRLTGLTLDYDDRISQVPYQTNNQNWSFYTLQIPPR